MRKFAFIENSSSKMRYPILLILLSVFSFTNAQVRPDSIVLKPPHEIPHVILPDTSLRITNFSPFFSLHVDSSLNYRFLINKDYRKYHWYIKDAPVGFKIDKDDGTLS